jgi:hypothetical protein
MTRIIFQEFSSDRIVCDPPKTHGPEAAQYATRVRPGKVRTAPPESTPAPPWHFAHTDHLTAVWGRCGPRRYRVGRLLPHPLFAAIFKKPGQAARSKAGEIPRSRSDWSIHAFYLAVTAKCIPRPSREGLGRHRPSSLCRDVRQQRLGRSRDGPAPAAAAINMTSFRQPVTVVSWNGSFSALP